MKIETTQYNSIQPIPSNSQGAGQAVADSRAGKASNAASIVVSEPVAESLRLAQQELNRQPDIDQAKVNTFKDALNQGKIIVDLAQLAEAMQGYHRR